MRDRNVLGIALVVFIAFFGFNFVMPILPLYVRTLGVGGVAQAALIAGLMLAISPLLAAVFSPLWGIVADRFGRKRMLQRSLVVMAICYTGMAFVTHWTQLFAFRAVIGVFGGFTSMTMAYVVAVAPPRRASAALGMLQSAQVGGVIVGPLCAGFVADHYGFAASFFSGAAVITAGLVALTLLTQDDRRLATGVAKEAESSALNGVAHTQDGRRLATGQAVAMAGQPGDVAPAAGASEAPAAGGAAPRGADAGSLAALRESVHLPGFAAAMVILFLAQFVDRSFGPILPLYVAALGAPPDQIASYAGSIISLAAVGTAVSASAMGQLAARLPAWRLLLVTLVAGIALCLPMALVQTPGQLMAARALLGLFAGGTLTLAYSLANQVIPAHRKGAAFGVLSSTALLGSASSPLLTGAMAGFDLRAVFVLDSALYAVAFFWAIRSAGVMRAAAGEPALLAVPKTSGGAGQPSVLPLPAPGRR